MKRLLIALIFLFTGVAFANPPTYYNTLSPPKYGECTNQAGKAIRYIPYPHHIFKMMYPGARFAVARGDAPLIVYDPQDISRLPKEHQEVIWWHECGHHALGHMTAGYTNNREERMTHETEADCYAGQAVREKRDFEPNDLKVAIKSMHRMGMPRERMLTTWKCAADL